jgi:thiol-disulfide isomerase/thioredoxin
VQQLAIGALALGAALLPAFSQAPTPKVVAYVELALRQGDLADAKALVEQYRRLNGDTPETLEAFSWVARGEAAAGNLDQAIQDAKQIEHAAQTSLATRKLDAEPHLPLALGAAYEVEANVLTQQNKRAEALQLLRAGMATWRGTSVADRLQKNINELTLQGRPMPLLRETAWIGNKPAPPSAWRGKPVLLFFWAHWCADCKAEAPIITQMAHEFEPKGLVVIAPTRLYGYTAEDENAPPAQEKAFIQRVFDTYYAGIPNVQVPLDNGNFGRFGASTTPTIVLVDRHGTVQLYHPGVMDESSLRAAIERIMTPISAEHRAARVGR